MAGLPSLQGWWNDMNNFTFARALPLFRALNDEELSQLIAATEEKRFSPGERIVRRGEKADSMYILREGSVRVPIFDKSGKQEHTVWLGPGDIFGEMAVVTGEPRGADVFADGEIEVCCLVLGCEDVESLL
jgi:CRP-like cAMP-binding protein